jgi:hypothetical protein
VGADIDQYTNAAEKTISTMSRKVRVAKISDVGIEDLARQHNLDYPSWRNPRTKSAALRPNCLQPRT